MEFTSLIDNPYNRITLMSIMGIATALLLVNAIVMTRNAKKNPELVNRMVLFTPALLILGVVFPSLMIHHHDNIQSDNRQIARDNIAIKYEVKQIFTHRHQTDLFTTEPSPVVVQSEEGEMITLNYVIDPETFEPFLTDIPKDKHVFRETPVVDITKG